MKKVLLLLLLYICTDITAQTNIIQIYNSDSLSIRKIYKFPNYTSGKKDFYIQILKSHQFPEFRQGDIFSYMNGQMISRHGSFLESGIITCSIGPSLASEYVYDFAKSRLDTNLLIGFRSDECEGSGEINLTTNNGVNFTTHFSGLFAFSAGVGIDPYNDSIIYVNFNGGPNQGLRKTTNRGLNWIIIDTVVNGITPLHVSPLNTQVIFTLNGNNILRSTQGGYNFTQITSPAGAKYSFEFDSLTSRTYITTEAGIFYSTNHGDSWVNTFNILCRGMEIDPVNSNIIYAGTDLGIYKSTNSGANWEMYNNAVSGTIGILKNPGMGDTIIVSNSKAVYKVFGPSINDSSAAYFPMKIGNSYTYRWQNNVLQTGYYRVKVTKDTLINGYKYFYFAHSEGFNRWLRFDTLTSKILMYSTSPCPGYTQDQLIDSLGSRLNDQINLQCGSYGIRTCIDTNFFSIFGQQYRSKRFNHSGVTQEQVRYVKNIGPAITLSGEPNLDFQVILKGCIIDGVLYGDTAAYDRSISGTVTYSGGSQNVSSGKVHLVKLDTNSGKIIILDSANIQANGTYFIPNPPPETSYVMAYQDDDFDYVPTYYPSTILWENAVKVHTQSNLNNINIAVYGIDSSANNGQFRGVTYSTRSPSAGRVQGAFIYAKVGSTFKNYSFSDTLGIYAIRNLPYGNYLLIANRLGYLTDSLSFNFTNGVIWDSLNFYMQPLFTNIQRTAQLLPDKYRLFQNYPNPFNPATRIIYHLPEKTFTAVKIYDITGRLINKLFEGEQQAGEYSITFDAQKLSSGVYFYSLETEEFKETKRMLLIK